MPRATVFELFRLSLLVRPQLHAFNQQDDAQPQSRESWIRQVFQDRQPFERRGIRHEFVALDGDGDAIVGKVGKLINREENEPPERSLTEVTRDAWTASVMVVDPTEHDDGQKIAIEKNREIGASRATVRALCDAINQRYSSDRYVIEVAPIVDGDDFWRYATKHKGRVRNVTFNFIVPNMFRSVDALDKDLKKWRDEENAQQVSLKLNANNGLRLESSEVATAVDYVQRGGGSITAQDMDGKGYNSNNSIKNTRVEGMIKSSVDSIRNAIQRIMDRE
ncbi:MAG: hypothetical protein OXE73_01625 [Gammaproteobacteria bacterium]|nr:hypothetical protein [Gammaproteobacteria bacterium]